MMFEVEDLAVASPATVSRCGMVLTEPSQLGYIPLILSYSLTFKDTIIAKYAEMIKNSMVWFADAALIFV